MGGYGSGRPGNSQKAEHFRTLDANALHRAGALKAGWSGGWQWSNDNEVVARIEMRATTNAIILAYRVRSHGADWESIVQPVALIYVSCNYGGDRPYFRCPGITHGRPCNRRVGKLFAAGRYFLCRHCYRIAYASQSETIEDRLLRRANKRHVVLGGQNGTAYGIATKPKGMWQRTYDRHCDEIERCEDQADRAFLARYRHSFSSEEQEMYFGE